MTSRFDHVRAVSVIRNQDKIGWRRIECSVVSKVAAERSRKQRQETC